LLQTKPKPETNTENEVTEAAEMITDWISSNLPLRHEGLGRRLQVPLE
jgi:hypothetical protein